MLTVYVKSSTHYIIQFILDSMLFRFYFYKRSFHHHKSQIKPILNLVIFICSKVNLLLILFTEMANHVTNFIVTTSLGMISFTIRSLITAISLALLVPIHIGQTVLRVVRCIHGITMGFVRTSSKMVNDFGMLNVDLIKESYVYEAGEQMKKLEEEQKFVRKR